MSAILASRVVGNAKSAREPEKARLVMRGATGADIARSVAMSTDHTLLWQHHRSLEKRIATLVMRAEDGDCHELATEWNRFEDELHRHFDVEETELFPRLARQNAKEVAELRQEHEQLRKDLLALGIRSDLHLLGAEGVQSFIADLRAHARREDRTLYRWSAEQLDAHVWETVEGELRDVAKTTKLKVTGVAAPGPAS